MLLPDESILETLFSTLASSLSDFDTRRVNDRIKLVKKWSGDKYLKLRARVLACASANFYQICSSEITHLDHSILSLMYLVWQSQLSKSHLQMEV